MISTTEAEFGALSEVVTTLKMVQQSMEIEATLPITVYVHNIGAIYLVNNCTKVTEHNTWILAIIEYVKCWRQNGENQLH